jgi:basic membrane protein A
VLIIGAPPPTNNGQPIETAPTIASNLAAGADALRRQGIAIRVVYAPATSRASRAQDAATIRSAAKHAHLVVIFPPTQRSLTDIAATARRYPRTRFVLIDRSVHEQRYPPNVTGMPFDNAEVGYLAGYLATLEGGHPPTVSVVAGVPIPPVAEIIQGFRAGAHRADPHGRVLVSFSHTFSDPTVCETMANHQISSGSKAIFNVAGTCGFGALHAADVRGVWAIGVDTDLSSLSPAILASVVKRFDNAVQLAARLFLQHRLPQATDAVLNLGNDGVDVVGISSSVPAATRARVERIAASLRRHDNTKLGGM